MTHRFEGPEHRKIGDSVLLSHPNGDVMGGSFDYEVGSGINLSYGQIVALAGDFYGNCQTVGDAEQISDQWDINTRASIDRFLANASLLEQDTRGYLKAVLDIMAEEEREILQMLDKGRDAAQVYKETGSKFNTKWAICTKLDYLWLSLCNWDHFGEDAVKAYKAGHWAALEQAERAFHTQSTIDLRRAYFLEAFATHFLTDLFSSGHMRTPRRALHQTYFRTRCGDISEDELYKQLEARAWPKPWPADQCAQAMHDEDCANGLWAASSSGNAWPSYGDKQLMSAKGNLAFDAAVTAAQAGVHEVYETFRTGQRPHHLNFNALREIPKLDETTASNFAPLFEVVNEGKTLRFRSRLDDRGVPVYEEHPVSGAPFSDILARIRASSQHQAELPLTLPLLSPSKLLQFRWNMDTELALVECGQVFSQSPVAVREESWNMFSHKTLTVPKPSGQLTWLSADRIDDDVHFIVGTVDSEDSSVAYHLGVDIGNHLDNRFQMVSFKEVEDDNVGWAAGDVRYGRLSDGRETLAMVKSWHRPAKPWRAKFELWTFDEGVRRPPTLRSLRWPNAPVSAPYVSFCVSLDPADRCETYVTCSSDTAKTTWTFLSFKNDYAHANSWTFEEQLGERAQRVLPIPSSGREPCRFVRLFYGQQSDHIRVDVLTVRERTLSVDSTTSVPIWRPGVLEEEHLLWFLADASGNGTVDLIGLLTDQRDGSLAVLAVPGAPGPEGPGFDAGGAVRSAVASDRGSTLTAAFMQPLGAYPARCRFARGGAETPAAIVAAFENRGILGVRLLRPAADDGSLKYVVDGQIPAIAGQPAIALGWAAARHKPGRDMVGLLVE